MAEHSARPHYACSWLFSAAFAFALLVGGGGAEGPFGNGIIAAIGAVLLVALTVGGLGPSLRPTHPGALAAVVLAGLLLLIPLVQLIPLPPGLWHALPGREHSAHALLEVGAAETWRPLSLDPIATRRFAVGLLFPVALFLHAARSSRDANLRLVGIVAICAGASGIVGAMQIALGNPAWLSFYDGPSIGAASGIFANPNHQSIFMVTGMVVSAILIRAVAPRQALGGQAQIAGWIAVAFFALMAVASGSRAGLVLLGLTLPGAMLVALGRGSLIRWAVGLMGILSILWIVALLYPGTNTLAIRESFHLGNDIRAAYLPDILFTLDQYWSAGSGLGTFVEVFAPNENLDLAQRGYLNHAHNDVLEWLIETGVSGAIFLGLAGLVLLYSGYKALGDRRDDSGMALGAVLIVAIVALHSLIDYPLRTSTLASVTALALGLLVSRWTTQPQANSRPRRTWRLVMALVVALPIAAEALRLHLVEWGLRSGRENIAFLLSPADARVLAERAAHELRIGNNKRAELLASQATEVQPLNVAALRLLAQAREAQGKPAGPVWQLASALGWRDARTQYWAFQQALMENQPGIAAVRADALLRTGHPPADFLRLLRIAARDGAFAEALANRLRLNPAWRGQFFSQLGEPSKEEIAGLLATFQAQIKNGDPPTRADGQSLVTHLVKHKRYRDAAAVDRIVAGNRADGSNLLDDGGFGRLAEDYSRNSTPFDWQLRKGPHTSGSVDTAPPSFLVAETDGERIEVAADRYVQLPPGRYQLAYRVRSDRSDAFRVKLVCAGRSDPLAQDVAALSRGLKSRSLNFAVDHGCTLIRLVIESQSAGEAATAEFDNFILKAA